MILLFRVVVGMILLFTIIDVTFFHAVFGIRYNRSEKEEAIMDAFRHFNLI